MIAEMTEQKLAAHLFESLRNKIMPLSDSLILYPNHGAGSACGKNMSKETTDTLGHQKQVNYEQKIHSSSQNSVFLMSIFPQC